MVCFKRSRTRVSKSQKWADIHSDSIMVCSKRSRTTASKSQKWADIHSDILESVFEHLSFRDVLASGEVCSNWFSAVNSFITFKSKTQPHSTPCLMLPQDKSESSDGGHGYYNLEANMVCCKLENFPEGFTESCCIGSSHGWLIFLDERAVPLLFNPSLLVQRQLPNIGSFLGVLNIERTGDGGYCIKYGCQNNSIRYMESLRQNFIHKGILSSDPCLSVNNYGVVVICGHERKLAYCKNGDNFWTAIDGKHQPYHDIICSRDHYLYALGNNASLEVWDFDVSSNIPVKMEIEMCFPEKSMKFWNDFGDLYAARFYLVESIRGDIMLVVRFLGELVNEDDEPIHEEDLLSEEDTHPLICPYKTLLFHVYKLDLKQKMWVEVDNLGDQALFLGGNHSISVSADQHSLECKGNAIYFTDDYWDRMHEDYLYGGHDMGVFSLKEQCVKPFYECRPLKIQPPPCWVNPSPW